MSPREVKEIRAAFEMNRYEAEAYRLLLSDPERLFPVQEFEKWTSIPRCRIYDTLDSLERKFLITSVFEDKTVTFPRVVRKVFAIPLGMAQILQRQEFGIFLERAEEALSQIWSRKTGG